MYFVLLCLNKTSKMMIKLATEQNPKSILELTVLVI